MSRKPYLLTKQVVAATALVVGLSGPAFAEGDSGDNSLNPFVGESWAYFNGGHNIGSLNQAPAPRASVLTRLIHVAPAQAGPATAGASRTKVTPAPAFKDNTGD